MDMYIRNAAFDPWWMSRLEWLMSYQPRLMKPLYHRKNREQKLHDDRVWATKEKKRLIEREIPKEHADDQVFESMIVPPVDQKPPKPLSKKDVRMIRSWADRMIQRDERYASRITS